MRKYLPLALVCVLSVFTLVGCGNSTTTEQKSASTESSKSSESTESSTPSTEKKNSNDEVKNLKISGTFYNEADKEERYTFNDDGSVLIYVITKDGNVGAPGQFTQSDEELSIYVGDIDEDSKKVYSYTYDGKTLTLKDVEDGDVLMLVKEEK